MSDGEDREPRLKEGCVAALGLRRIAPARAPATADHIQDASAVRRLGLEDVEGQGHAVLVAVYDVGNDFACLCGGISGEGHRREQDYHKGQVSHGFPLLWAGAAVNVYTGIPQLRMHTGIVFGGGEGKQLWVTSPSPSEHGRKISC